MRLPATAWRNGLFGLLAVASTGAAGLIAVTVPGGSATAATDPCAASEVAKTLGAVATSVGTYLDAHPQTNQAMTTIALQQPGPQSLAAMKTYLDSSPQTGKDMQRLQQPLVALSARCNLPLTLPQMMGLIQAAQQSGGGASALPAATRGGAPLPAPAVAGLP
jgi:hemophore